MRSRFLSIAALLAVLVSCGGWIPPDVNRALEDAAEIQALLPALEASHALVQPTAAVASRVRTVTTLNGGAGFPATPAVLWGTTAAGGVARYPATGYISDFYGEQGAQAYLELRQSSDLAGGYQVSLYIYPALSAAVWYTLEQYRVTADSWFNIVDATGAPDATAYEKWETHYFDGRAESRTLVWSRYSTGTEEVYASFEVPATFTSAFTYPASIPQPTRVAPASAEDFASESTSVIPGKGNDPDTTAVEFYNQIVQAGGFLKQSRSYVTDTYKNGTARTVRMYQADTVTGGKTVKAKSAGSFSRGNKDWTAGSEETISITDNAGALSYESVVVTTRDGVTQSTVTVSVAETALGSNRFTGLATIVTPQGTTMHTVTMDASNGVDIADGTVLSAGIRTLTYVVNVDSLQVPGGTAQGRTLSIDGLGNGGSFTGAYVGGVLDGTYTSAGGSSAMVVGRLFVEIDAEAY